VLVILLWHINLYKRKRNYDNNKNKVQRINFKETITEREMKLKPRKKIEKLSAKLTKLETKPKQKRLNAKLILDRLGLTSEEAALLLS
jgi:hypothetical protein